MTERPGKVPLIDVDADAAYEAFLSEMEPEKPDQYWLEVAYQCIKMELQLAMRTFAMEIRIHDLGKKWAQKNYPEGRGARAATFGREARGHFKRIRGVLPS